MESTRDRLLDAVVELMHTRGLARATTREIARAAGFSEATLYKHFRDKDDLLLCVLQERMPEFITTLKQLPDWVGRGTMHGNLAELAGRAVVFYEQLIPLMAAIFSEPDLLARHREGRGRGGPGPHRAIDAVAAYIRAEQHMGRLSQGASPEAAAALLLGACFQRAFLRGFMGGKIFEQSDEAFAQDLAQALSGGTIGDTAR